MTTVYLAYGSGVAATLALHRGDEPVDLLVAYPVLDDFLRRRHEFNIRSWCLDSGAFSAHNSGLVIRPEEYTSRALDVDACEVFGLDVIGDADATRRNLERSWELGLAAIPTFHYGEPEAALRWCADHAPKIALGGVAKMTRGHRAARYEWLKQCVARVWPKRVHAFGCASWEAVRCAPFDSVDASSWGYAPQALGRWAGYTGRQQNLHSRGKIDLWLEVVEHRKRAEWAAWRWRDELEEVRA